jgi:hypothetical protein
MTGFCARVACSQGLVQYDLRTVGPTASPWQHVLFLRLRYAYEQLLIRRPETSEAEVGLGIPPSAYWYIGRVEPGYANIVILSRLNPHTARTQALVSSFDSGGLWHNKMKTTLDPLSDSDKRQFFSSNAMTPETFENPMTTWLKTAFNGVLRHYCRNVTPASHYLAEVIIDAPSNPQDWAWELAIENEAPADAFPRLISLYMSRADYHNYQWWVEAAAGLDRDELVDHIDYVRSVISETTTPYNDATSVCASGLDKIAAL